MVRDQLVISSQFSRYSSIQPADGHEEDPLTGLVYPVDGEDNVDTDDIV